MVLFFIIMRVVANSAQIVDAKDSKPIISNIENSFFEPACRAGIADWCLNAVSIKLATLGLKMVLP